MIQMSALTVTEQERRSVEGSQSSDQGPDSVMMTDNVSKAMADS